MSVDGITPLREAVLVKDVDVAEYGRSVMPPRPELARRPLLYLAGPMSPTSKWPLVRQWQWRKNVLRGKREALSLVLAGYAVYCPHLNAHLPWRNRRQVTWEAWLSQDLEWVRRADVLYRLPGPSKGADQEERVAKRNGVPRVYSFEELEAWREGQLADRRKTLAAA